MPFSADVSAGDDILATDHNNIRRDIFEGGYTIAPLGAVIALTIDQDHDSRGLFIDCIAPNNTALDIAAKYCIESESKITGGRGLNVFRTDGLELAEAFPLAFFNERNAECTQPVVEIDNDGAGEEIKFTNPVSREYEVDPADLQIDGVAAGVVDHATAGWSVAMAADYPAGVHLPLGATVTDVLIAAWCDNNGGIQTLTAQLRRQVLGANTEDVMSESSVSWGDGEAASFKTFNDNTIDDAIIATGYSYHIHFSAVDALVYLSGIRILYTIDEPLS